MKALTLWQPWTAVVASGLKRIENRPWEPPVDFFGERFAIHAGKKLDKNASQMLRKLTLPSDPPTPEIVRGAVVATARFGGVVTSAEDAERLAGENQGRWFFGPFGWLLYDIRQLADPIYCRGGQKLWNLTQTQEALIRWGQGAKRVTKGGTP